MFTRTIAHVINRYDDLMRSVLLNVVCPLLTAFFLILKLTVAPSITWLFVLSPLWMPPLVVFSLVGLLSLVIVLGMVSAWVMEVLEERDWR